LVSEATIVMAWREARVGYGVRRLKALGGPPHQGWDKAKEGTTSSWLGIPLLENPPVAKA
jgi:hypothetical protein